MTGVPAEKLESSEPRSPIRRGKSLVVAGGAQRDRRRRGLESRSTCSTDCSETTARPSSEAAPRSRLPAHSPISTARRRYRRRQDRCADRRRRQPGLRGAPALGIEGARESPVRRLDQRPRRRDGSSTCRLPRTGRQRAGIMGRLEPYEGVYSIQQPVIRRCTTRAPSRRACSYGFGNSAIVRGVQALPRRPDEPSGNRPARITSGTRAPGIASSQQHWKDTFPKADTIADFDVLLDRRAAKWLVGHVPGHRASAEPRLNVPEDPQSATAQGTARRPPRPAPETSSAKELHTYPTVGMYDGRTRTTATCRNSRTRHEARLGHLRAGQPEDVQRSRPRARRPRHIEVEVGDGRPAH